jgi:hypothetical protein
MAVLFIVVLGTGCKTISSKTLLPSETEIQLTKFESYNAVLGAFNLITPTVTTIGELNNIGFDIYGQNVDVMTYVDVLEMFLSSPALDKDDLPIGVMDCLDAKESCRAYKLTYNLKEKERYGNLFADYLGFRQKTKKTGWRFEALFVIVDEVVVYALYSGQPDNEVHEIKRDPLGPFKSLDLNDVKELL